MTARSLPRSDDPTGLVVLVPEADPLAAPFRDRFDPAAAEGMPAHVTVLYPFRPLEKITPKDRKRLRRIFSEIPSFPFSLPRTDLFTEVLYLAPVPRGPFDRLTKAVTAAFPDCQPYAGEIAEPVPHLTLAQAPSRRTLHAIERDFREAARGSLPIASLARAVSLVSKRSGIWTTAEVYPLKSVSRR